MRSNALLAIKNMINEKLENLLLSLPKPQLLEVMLSAVDIMESYNGQSIQRTVMKAVGAEIIETDEAIFFKLPSKKELRESLN